MIIIDDNNLWSRAIWFLLIFYYFKTEKMKEEKIAKSLYVP